MESRTRGPSESCIGKNKGKKLPSYLNFHSFGKKKKVLWERATYVNAIA